MFSALDGRAFRDVTDALFPGQLRADAGTALKLLHSRYGRWCSATASLDGVVVDQYAPSGLLVRVNRGRIERAWVPTAVGDDTVQEWRAGLEAALAGCGALAFSRPVLCHAPVEHRWELPRAGMVLSPVPAVAPRPGMLWAEHPAMLQMHFEGCNDTHANATRADRRAEWCTLLLNALTLTGCRQTLHGPQAWAWDGSGALASKWAELVYFAPQVYDTRLVEAARGAASAGGFAAAASYYLDRIATANDAMVLPDSLDETLAAAEALPDERKVVLRRAARWIKAGDRAGDESRSLHYVALASGLEALASEWTAQARPVEGFKRLLTDLLPYPSMEKIAGKLYGLRSALAHGGTVFPDDWIDRPASSEQPELSLLLGMVGACRLVAVNWIRARAGLALVGGSLRGS